MTGKKSLLMFCCILVVGTVLLAGCTDTEGRGMTPAAPVMTPGTGGSLFPTCPIPATGKPGESPDFGAHFTATELLTRPSSTSVTVSLVPDVNLEIYILYGTSPGDYSCQTSAVPAKAGSALNVTIQGLLPDTYYYYRTCFKEPGSAGYQCGTEHSFHTQRSPGSTFTFGIQADSHPEREKQMFNSALYDQTMDNVAKDPPDFYITLGDDFSIDNLIEKDQLSPASRPAGTGLPAHGCRLREIPANRFRHVPGNFSG